MGRKSKAKANKNNQQPPKVVENATQPAPSSELKVAPFETLPTPESAPIPETPHTPDKTEQVAIQEPKEDSQDIDDTPFQPSPTGKKKKNRNRNKKKNQQNAEETEVMAEAPEVVKEGQSEEQKDEKPLIAPSKRSQRNKKKNAERASADENRTDETKDTIEKANRDNVAVKIEESQSQLKKQPTPEEPKPIEKQEAKTKPDKGQKKGQKSQKTDQQEGGKKTDAGDINKNTQDKLPEPTTNDKVAPAEAPKVDNLPKIDEVKELAKLVNAAAKVEVPLVDPITIQINQPLVITAEPCKDKPKEPSTEATLAQLIELVSNTDIPLKDAYSNAGKEKMAEFQKPIADTGAALAELVNAVARVEVPLKDIVEPVLEGPKGKKGKQPQQKGQEAKKPETEPNEAKKDKKAKDAKEKKDKVEPKETKKVSQESPKVLQEPPVEEAKQTTTEKNETKDIKPAQGQETKEPEKVKDTLDPKPKIEEHKAPPTLVAKESKEQTKEDRASKTEEAKPKPEPAKLQQEPEKPKQGCEKPQEPAKLQQESMKPKQEHVKPQQEPVISKEKPAELQQEPAKPQEPVKLQQEPAKPQQEPAKPPQGSERVVQEPAKPQQEPVKPQQKPVKPQQESAKQQQKPAKVQQELAKSQQEPAKQQEPSKPQDPSKQQEPVKQQQKPVKLQQEPVKSQQEQAKPQQEQAKPKQEPIKSKQGSVTPQQEPAKPQQEPAKLQQEPERIQQEPAKLKQEPIKSKQGPVTPQQEPAKPQEPAKLQQEPERIQQDAEKPQQEPVKLQQESIKPMQEPAKSDSPPKQGTPPDSIKKPQSTTPPTKKNKEDANLKEANEKSEAKAKEVPEKNPQEKMDAITFVPDKLIDILDTKMETPANTGAIKKIPKQGSEMAAQTQISVQPGFEDKPKASEEVRKPQQQKQEKSGKTSPQKSPKKPQVPPKPEHLTKKSPGSPKEPTQAPKKLQLMSDDEEEFIEYKFTPRQVFLATICQVCKIALQNPNPCLSCLMVSYCSEAHAKEDAVIHQQLCRALQEIARKRGGHVYNNAKILSNDDFRNLRVHTLNLCESLTQRSLQPFEKEILLFPRICCTATCREWRPPLLVECQKCGQVSYCKEQPGHLLEDHQRWCPFFLLYQKLIVRQKNIGRIEPSLPSRIFLQRYELPSSMDEVFKELYKNNPAIKDDCTYATLTQLATAPLTAFNAVVKTQLNVQESLTIHLVGAELQFEGDTLDKWEAFFLHLIPQVLELRVVFIGPELNAENLPLDILSRIRMCRTCRQACRGVKFDFQCGKLYHDYAKQPAFTKPDLICFFNPGLYRATGFSGLDTWPETIKAATSLNCPIVVTSYTELESPQDLAQLHRDSTRPLNLIHAPAVNPFSSQRPERNFISDEVSPMIFKNYFVFIVS